MTAWDEFFGALEHAQDAIIKLVESGRLALDAAHGEGNILTATANGKKKLTQRLINIGADVNLPASECLVRPLHVTASKNFPAIAATLLRHGADVNAKAAEGVRSEFFFSPHRGETALHLASKYGDEPLVALLLMHDADVSLPDANGDLPVDWLERRKDSLAKESIRKMLVR